MNSIDNILLVDDSGTARMILKLCLEIAGFHDQNFIEAKNGEEAWGLLQHQKIDLLITDLNMPVIDGHSLLIKINSSGAIAKPLIMVATSSANPAKAAELKKLGAHAILNKPISPAQIVQVWKEIIVAAEDVNSGKL